MIRSRCRNYRYIVVHVHVQLIRVGGNIVLLVDVVPGNVLHVVFMYVVGNMTALFQRMSLHRFLVLLLDMPMLWW